MRKALNIKHEFFDFLHGNIAQNRGKKALESFDRFLLKVLIFLMKKTLKSFLFCFEKKNTLQTFPQNQEINEKSTADRNFDLET